MSEYVHLFSNGFEFDCWQEKNCDRCANDGGGDEPPFCDLITALFTDTPGGGGVKPETAARLGWKDEYRGQLAWPCAEFAARAAVPVAKPAAYEMRDAGAAMLPGLDDDSGVWVYEDGSPRAEIDTEAADARAV